MNRGAVKGRNNTLGGNVASRTGNNHRTQKSNGANLGFEEKLWQAADKLRSNMDAAEYKHVVLGLIFLKYISDAFQERHQQLELLTSNPDSEYFIKEPKARYEVLEDRDEYKAENVFWSEGSQMAISSGERQAADRR